MLHRLRSLVLLTCLASTTIIACGGDDDDDATGGKGGTSGAGAGGAAAGTSAGGSGSSGQSGKGGAAGTTAGSSGTAGSAGANGGTGGATGGTAGTGPAGSGGVPVGGTAGQSAGGTSAGSAGSSAGGTSAGTSGAGQSAGGTAGAGGTSGGSGGSGGSANACLAPNVLIVLDRTMSMHFDPNGNEPTDKDQGYKTSKWSQAIGSIEELVSAPTDATIRFGLELWPKDPKDGTCVTLAERVGGKFATNPQCQNGEIAVPLGLNTGKTITDYLDPSTTLLCVSTPTGTALEDAGKYLEANTEEGRENYIILVTDGADWKTGGCPNPDPIPVVDGLAKKGIKTFVVGFSTKLDQPVGTGLGTGTSFMNDMACAGQTAKGFPDSCKKTADGGYVALDNTASPIYLQAGTGAQLSSTLQSVAAPLCCDCEASCEPPDMLFVLDRTQSMHFDPQGKNPTDAPAYQSSKWYQAVTGVEKVTAAPRDQYFRFGLELWPRDPKDGSCVTLSEIVTTSKQATNPKCDVGEIAIQTGLGNGQAISDTLDPATTRLCKWTPTGTALTDASSYLATHYTPGRRQYAVLVTDGADWQTCSGLSPDPLPVVQKMAASGIKTFIVGFIGDPDAIPDPSGTSLGKTFLNDMACAGQTALGFPGTCKLTATGYVAVKNDGPRLYLTADDSNELASTLNEATDALGCKP